MKTLNLNYKLNLQFFAEGEGEGEQQEQQQENESLTLTPDELAKKIESESDRKLEKARKKWEADYAAKLEAEKEEAARLAKLSAAEREKAELDKLRKDLERQQQELAREKLKSQTVKELTDKKLPASFADFLLAADAETTLSNINTFKEVYDADIQRAVEERLKGSTPQTSGSSAESVNPWKRETLNLTKQAEIFKTNPELAKQLMAQAKK